jgi:hypothetical protein
MIKQSIAVATVALGAAISPANAQQSHVQRVSAREAQVQPEIYPQFDPFSQGGQGQAGSQKGSNPDIDVCIGASVLIGGGIAAMAMRGKKREEQLLSENRKKSEKWFEPGREDRRR